MFDLKTAREEKGMTQLDLAIKARLSRQAVSQFENGTIKPSVKVAKVIAEILGFDWTKFYEDNSQNKR